MITIQGLTPSFKVPVALREVNFSRGVRSSGEAIRKLVVTGNKLSTGNATADLDIKEITSEEDADTILGAGSEGAIQCYHALRIRGVHVFAAPVAEASGGAAATLTITIAGAYTTTGTVTVFLAGKAFSVTATSAMSVTQVAAALVLKINGDTRLFATAANSAGVITVTTRQKGIRQNRWIGRADNSQVPTGLTCVITGGTATTGGMVPFTGGAGADDVTAVLAALTSDRWHFQAWAQNDATNVALIKAQLNSEDDALIMHTEHAVFALNGTTSASATFASGTLNNARMTLVHLTNCELIPSAMAAQVAAVRSVTVGANPNARYNGVQLPSIPPQSQQGDVANLTTNDTLLNSGVLPLTMTADGRVLIVRAIQSHCLTGSSPDFRTLDWGQVDVPDRISDEAGDAWEAHSEQNPYVSANPSPGADVPASGKTYPDLWNSTLFALLKKRERDNWLQDVDAHPPITEFQTDRLMSAITCVVQLQNHIVGIQVNQTAA